MSSTNFIDKQTIIQASWLNDVNSATYLGGAVYTPSGAGAVVTNMQNKLRESVSVKDYGATGTGADDTAAIQLAITNNPGKTIYFPAGVYVITSTLLISSNNTRLVGAGSNCTYIRNDSVGLDAVRFYCTSTVATSDYVNGVGLSGIYVYRTIAATTGSGIRAIQVNGGVFKDFVISDCPEGLSVEGGQFNTFDQFKLFASGAVFDLNLVDTSSLMAFKEATLSGGLYQPCYTCVVSNFFAAGSKKIYTVFLVANGDGIQMSNGYIGGGRWTLFHVKGLRDGGYVSGVTVNNVYFDGIGNVNGSSTCVYVAADAYSTFAVYDITFANCIFGNTVTGAIIGRRNVVTLKIIGSTFVNINTWAIDVQGNSGISSLNVVGNQFNGIGLLGSGTGTVAAIDLLSFVYNSNTVRTDSGLGVTVKLSGTVRTASIVGNTHRANTADLSYSLATISDRLVISANSGTDTNPATTFNGERVGNIAVTDSKTLDWYEESSTTPTISFGGASVGITYTNQTCVFTRVGNLVTFNCRVTLLTKGSSVGNLEVNTNIPYVNSTGIPATVVIQLNAVAATVLDTAVTAYIPNTGSSLNVFKGASGYAVILTNTDCLDATRVICSGSYRV